MSELPDRFWARVEKTDSCWNWTGLLDRKGYGRSGRNEFAHRVAYNSLVGPIPDGYDIDHLCRVTRCVNPAHLEAVPPAENRMRQEISLGGGPGTCRRGHPRTPENTFTSTARYRSDGTPVPETRCKPCKNALQQARRAMAASAT